MAVTVKVIVLIIVNHIFIVNCIFIVNHISIVNHIFTDHDEDCHLLLMRRPPSIRIPDISWSFKFTQRKAELFFMKSHKIFITIIT